MWTFPTGFVDAGEQPDAAVRETLEEASVECTIEGLLSAVTLVWQDRPMLYLIFRGRYIVGEPAPDGQETEAAAFLGLDELAALPCDGQNAFIARRILAGEARPLRTYPSAQWHAMYRTTYA